MAKEITKMMITYENGFKYMRKKLIKDLKCKRISIGDLVCIENDFHKFKDIYNTLIYLYAGSNIEVK